MTLWRQTFSICKNIEAADAVAQRGIASANQRRESAEPVLSSYPSAPPALMNSLISYGGWRPINVLCTQKEIHHSLQIPGEGAGKMKFTCAFLMAVTRSLIGSSKSSSESWTRTSFFLSFSTMSSVSETLVKRNYSKDQNDLYLRLHLRPELANSRLLLAPARSLDQF